MIAMIAEVYEAFLDSGASEAKAKQRQKHWLVMKTDFPAWKRVKCC